MAHPASHPYVKDPVRGLRTYGGLRRLFATSLLGALLALGMAVALRPLEAGSPWLRRSLAEGLVFSASVALFLAVCVVLAWAYMGRPLGRIARERGLDPRPCLPAPERPGFSALILLGVLGAAVPVALAFEYRYRDLLADPTELRRGLGAVLFPPGRAIPSGAGIALTAFMVVGTNWIAGWLRWLRRAS
jgi:hypothetical protein